MTYLERTPKAESTGPQTGRQQAGGQAAGREGLARTTHTPTTAQPCKPPSDALTPSLPPLTWLSCPHPPALPSPSRLLPLPYLPLGSRPSNPSCPLFLILSPALPSSCPPPRPSFGSCLLGTSSLSTCPA